MAELFGRKYELYIGKPVSVTKDYLASGAIIIDNYVDVEGVNRSSPNTFLVTDSNIKFDVKKDKSSESNKASITVYNPPKNIVEYLELMSTKKVTIILKAGYEETIKEIFRGTIEKFEFKFDGPTSKLTLKCADGEINLKEALTSRSYPVGTSYKKIVEDLAKDLGVPLGLQVNVSGSTRKPTYFSGKTSVSLQWLAKSTNSDFSVQDGTMCWVPEDVLPEKEIYVLTADTGLVGEVMAYNKNDDKNANDSTGVLSSIKVVSLLNGAIYPTSAIYVESSDGRYQGYYKVAEITHSGELESNNDWTSTIIAEQIKISG